MKNNLFGKVFTAIKTDKLSDAASSIDKLIDKNPSNPNNYIKKGDVFQKNGDGNKAVEEYHKAADFLLKQGFLKKALVVYKLITRIDPDDAKASANIEKILSELQSPKTVTDMKTTPVQDALTEMLGPELTSDGGIEEIDISAGGETYGSIDDDKPDEGISLSASEAEDLKHETDEDALEISRNDFFKPFSNEEVKEIFRMAEVRLYNSRNMVVTEGDSGDSIYVIKDGNANVVSHILGRVIQLATLSRGDVFGEVAFLTGRTRTASVIADGSLVVYELNRLLIENMIEQRPEIMDYLNDIYHIRVKETIKKVKDGNITVTGKTDTGKTDTA